MIKGISQVVRDDSQGSSPLNRLGIVLTHSDEENMFLGVTQNVVLYNVKVLNSDGRGNIESMRCLYEESKRMEKKS